MSSTQMERTRYELIKDRYGYVASWALWAEVGATPKSNIGELNIFDDPLIHQKLNPNFVLVGLNVSRGLIKTPFANFHDSRTEATDFKIRYAIKNTILWGAYMTDILKDFNQKESGKVAQYLRTNRQFEIENCESFVEEINTLNVSDVTLIALGNETYSILRRNFKEDFNILKVPHYANYSSKEKYREEVNAVIEKIPSTLNHTIQDVL